MTRITRCPTCRVSVDLRGTNPWRPFCSERCKLIDLGEWFNEDHRMEAPSGEWQHTPAAGDRQDGEL